MKAFISYSHRDSDALDRLHTHLAMLRRDNKITTWFDREIKAGDVLDDAISAELDSCDIFIALVSPDFLASDYCYNQEMKTALERHEKGTLRIVPVLVEPCDWSASPFRQFKIVPKDAKAVSEWTNPNNAFVDIVTEIRRIVEQTAEPDLLPRAESDATAAESLPEPTRKYKIKREFDEIDFNDFRESSFEQMRNYFRAAAEEIDRIDGIRARYVDRGPLSFGCTVVNQAVSRGTAHITVHCGNRSRALGDIYYSFGENTDSNSANGGFGIESDDYNLFLKEIMSFSGNRSHLTAANAAESLWGELLKQTGIGNDDD